MAVVAGDLVYIEPETVHREGYGEGELATVGFYFGSGPGGAVTSAQDLGNEQDRDLDQDLDQDLDEDQTGRQ